MFLQEMPIEQAAHLRFKGSLPLTRSSGIAVETNKLTHLHTRAATSGPSMPPASRLLAKTKSDPPSEASSLRLWILARQARQELVLLGIEFKQEPFFLKPFLQLVVGTGEVCHGSECF